MNEVFISYKQTDSDGQLTEDRRIAAELYESLTKQGCSVFYSNESLKEMGSFRYKADIDNALDSAQVMIVVLTKAEYATTEWVQYEWDSFFNDILSGIKPNAKLFTLTKDVSVSSLRRTLRNVQNFIYGDHESQLRDYLRSCLPSEPKADFTPQEKGDKFKLLKGKEITPEDIKKALELESLVYQEDAMQSLSSCLKYFDANPEIYLFMKDMTTGNIVANIDITPVTEDCYEMLRSGHFVDTNITPDMVLSYDLPCTYDLYFSSIVVHKDYRGTDLFLKMFNAVVEHFISLGEREVYAKRMLADAVTKEGEKFCKLFGMHKVRKSDHSSTLYEITLIPPQFRIISKATKTLHEYYKKKYEEAQYLFD